MQAVTQQRAMGRSRSIVATACATLVLLGLPAPAATAVPEAGRQPVAAGFPSASAAQAPRDGSDGTQAVLDYWTPERMQAARPPTSAGSPAVGAMSLPVAPGTQQGPQAMAAEEHETRVLTDAEVLVHPHSSVGKVFFTLYGFDFFCSASAVTTEGRWGEGSGLLVLTAGHCLNDGAGAFATSFVFVPGYTNGDAPFGRWVGWRLFTTPQWNSGLGMALARDVAFARVTGTEEYAGVRLDDVVDALEIAFTQPYPADGLHTAVQPGTGIPYASFGYGILNWGGESQVRTRSEVTRMDFNWSPPPMGIPSTHTGGSSGGPWLYEYAPGVDGQGLNVVNSVNSYVYGGEDVLYGPQFDDLIHQMWTFANRPAISIDDVQVDEGDTGTTAAVVTVSLDAAGPDVVTVDYTTVDGDAEAGSDYVSGAGTLTFQPGETSQDILVDVLGDALGEDHEVFTVALGNPSNAFLLDAFGEVTILDDEPVMSMAPVSVAEGDDGSTAATFTVTLDQPSDLAVTVDYLTIDDTATAPDDYTHTSGTLTIPPGGTSHDIAVDVIGDVLEEGDETFGVELSIPPNVFVEDDFAVGTIVDDDPELTIAPMSVDEGDDDTTTMAFTVTLDQPTGQAVTVDYVTTDDTATAPDDYTPTSGTLTFPPGETTQDVLVDVIGDTLDEDDETFSVHLSDPTNAVVLDAAETVGTIVDDDERARPGSSAGGGTSPDGFVRRFVLAGGSVSGEGEHGGVSVTTPNAGTVTIQVRNTEESAPNGFVYLPLAMDITAPDASEEDPLALVFTLDADAVPDGVEIGDLVVFRNGVPLVDCSAATSGEPCVSGREVDPDTGHVELRITTPAASTWNFGVGSVRLTGSDNVEAAIAWSQHGFDDGGASMVLLGRDDLFADSLSSGPVQGLTDAPLLLTPGGILDTRTVDELDRLEPRTIVILGGIAAVANDVEDSLVGLGYVVERVSGRDRIATAAAVAGRFFEDATSAIVARATGDDDLTRGFADSLGAGALGAATGQPVLLSDPLELSPATAAYLESSTITTVTVAGGAAALSDDVVDDLAALGIDVERVSGPDRFATAALLADRAGHVLPEQVLVVDGTGADAWASGFAAAAQATTDPLLLADGPRVPDETLLALAELPGSQLACGPRLSISACDRALTALTFGQ